MTEQLDDVVNYEGQEYALIRTAPARALFDPADHGVRVGWKSTASWRGFLCSYGIYDDELSLDELLIAAPEGEAAAALTQVTPSPVSAGDWMSTCFDLRYADLDVPIGFSGGMLLGQVRGLYWLVPHPAWRWKRVWELSWSDGRLLSARDHSVELLAIHKRAFADVAPDAETTFALIAETDALFEHSYAPNYASRIQRIDDLNSGGPGDSSRRR